MYKWGKIFLKYRFINNSNNNNNDNKGKATKEFVNIWYCIFNKYFSSHMIVAYTSELII